MERLEISRLYSSMNDFDNREIFISGWIRFIRVSKEIAFLDINDGSCFKNIQIVVEKTNVTNFLNIASLNVGAAVNVKGILLVTPQNPQPIEVKALDVIIEGESTPDYPLQKKRHSLEYLRTIGHLRSRTNTFSAVYRVRSEAAFAIHKFFNEQGFVYVHTPLITTSDCEGAGEMFRVTTLDLNDLPRLSDGSIDYSEDFFCKQSFLTVSGQLQGEAMAQAFGKIYTFGPTFRAEKSYTQRHAAEFWMIEPEIAFADLNDDMALAESLIKFVISYCIEKCHDELEFFNKFVDKELLSRLEAVAASDFVRISYTNAVDILQKNNNKFDYKVSWGCDLQTEHERFLTEQVFKRPVFVTDYPKDIKAFYMRLNDDGKTVAAVDCLVMGVGEILGGSQREERYDVLLNRINELNLNPDDYSWYLDLRKYGTTKHAGFGIGFERLIMYLTGMQNIRDVLPFPRTTGSALF